MVEPPTDQRGPAFSSTSIRKSNVVVCDVVVMGTGRTREQPFLLLCGRVQCVVTDILWAFNTFVFIVISPVDWPRPFNFVLWSIH